MGPRRLLNRLVVRPLAWLLLRLEVIGRENIPRDEPFILMINHTNFLDAGAAVVAMLPREVVLFTKEENGHLPIIGPLLRWYGVVLVERGEADVGALKQAVKILMQDLHILLVAPEGTRSYHGRLQPGKNGMAFIANQTGVPILPVGVTGVKEFWPNVRRVRRTHVQVKIGYPFRFRADGRVRKESLDEMTREAMYQLAALLPREQWGVYADIENATERYIESLEPGHSNLEHALHGIMAVERDRASRLARAAE